MKHHLNQVTAYAAQLMEREGIHGFVFCSQSYPEIKEAGYMENAIIICGINPYKATKTKMLYETGVDLKRAGDIDTQHFSLRNILPALKADVVDDKEYWWDLAVEWSSCLDEIAFEVEEFVNLNKCGDRNDSGYGGFSWKDYLYNSSEDWRCWNYDICLTGLLRELYAQKIKLLYGRDVAHDGDDITDYSVEMLNSQYHVRLFLSELANELDAEDDVIEEPIANRKIIMSE